MKTTPSRQRLVAFVVAVTLTAVTAETRAATVQAPASPAAVEAAHARLPRLRTDLAPIPGGFAPTSAPSLDGSPVEYLVVTRSDLLPEFERLASWKTAKGVPAVVRTLEDVRASTSPGSDLAETLRAYLRDAYQLWGVHYVLLGGDSEVVPVRYVSLDFLGLSHPLTELYYACLDGTWNADGDAFFGEAFESPTNPGDDVDLVAEVVVGRAPVSTVDEARIFVDKTLAYEQASVGGYQDRMLILAEVLFPPDYVPDGNPPPGDGAIFAEEIAALAPAWMQPTRLYEAAPFWPGASPLTTVSSVQAIDSGYGIVLHIGHGYRYTLSTGDGSLDVSHAQAFQNAGRAGLFYLLNCTATAFDFESMAEAILLNPQGGGAVVVGSAREAFPIAAREYQKAFFDELMQLGERRVGDAMTRSRERFVDGAVFRSVDRWTQFVYTLLGDPELPIRLRLRNDLAVSGIPSALDVGSQTLRVQVSAGGVPVPGARVAAVKVGEVYAYGTTDASGGVDVRIEPRSAGNLTFTVTSPDQPPWTRSVPVDAPAAAVVVQGLGLIDDGAGSGAGNLDGRADAGETVQLGVPLELVGTASAGPWNATLRSTDTEVTILQGNSQYGAALPGGTVSASPPFAVRLDPATPDGRVVFLDLDLDDGGTTTSRRIELLVHAARVFFVDGQFDDARAGNGDGVQQAGEEVDLTFVLENRGSGAATALRMQLTDPTPGMTLVRADTMLADLPPGGTVTTPPLSVREDDVSASRFARLTLVHGQAPQGMSRRIELRRPAAAQGLRFVAANAPDEVHLEWDVSTDADLLGYHVYRGTSESGPFARVTRAIVRQPYFRDRGLAASTRYVYRVAAVDSTFLEGPQSPAAAVSTNPPSLAGWPLAVDDFTASSPSIGDVDADGRPDVVAAAARIFAWDAAGVELRDADNNALTWGVFYGTGEAFGSVTLADLDAMPGKEIVAVTWDSQNRFVVVLNGQGQPLPGWPQPLAVAATQFNGASVAPVVTNLDGVGRPEILVAARDGRLYAWHADGSEVADGDQNPATHGVLVDTGSPFLRSAPGVADLDPNRPGFEIAFGSTDGKLHVVDAGGTPLPGFPRTTFGAGTPFGAIFASGVTLADLDRDQQLEMIFLESGHRLHAMHLDGSELLGFPVGGITAISGAVVPSPAVGNLVGDADLEIVAASSDGRLLVVDAAGQLVAPVIDSGAASESSPLLGDVDGDGAIEILFGNEDGVLQAWDLDGAAVAGFPLWFGAEVRGTPVLGDVDGDGDADLLVQTWDGEVALHDLGAPWVESLFPWPTGRGNPQRTGEFGFEVPTPVVASDLVATWIPDAGVRLRWQARPGAGGGALWRVRRAGPLPRDPLTGTQPARYNRIVLEGRRGSGDVEVVDATAVEPGWYVYGLHLLRNTAPDALQEVEVGRVAVRVGGVPPTALALHANVPNPFNPSTRVFFAVPARAGAATTPVRLDVYDVHGRHVKRLFVGELEPGSHFVDWEGRDTAGRKVGSGVYLVRMRAMGRVLARRMTLVR